ncbi:helix-turn-helix domain-containing protein [Streptomyces sp. NPDC102462]|uniref:helix-turn-helix domain-containing protein n=1 Tax=Streptomyces sp. NPDC102462 TaxID=3366178 RepID=UPI00382C73DC
MLQLPTRRTPNPPHLKVPVMPARLLSIPAVAAALDVDRRTVYRFIAAGDLPVVDLRTGTGRSRVRVPVASLDEFISRRAVVPPAARRRPRPIPVRNP